MRDVVNCFITDKKLDHNNSCMIPTLWGAKCVKNTSNAIFAYLPLIYKYDTDLAKYLPDLLYIYVRFINVDPIYISQPDI